MRIRMMIGATAALAVAATVAAGGHTSQATPTPQPPNDRRPTITMTPNRAVPANPVMTITGCLQQPPDGKGARPSVAARGGTIDTYVLSNVKMSPSSSVSGIGVSTKYEIQGIAEPELKKHLDHEVELMGQIAPPETGTPASNTSVFRATTLKMLSATCNAAQ
jgi:hypothetical protein